MCVGVCRVLCLYECSCICVWMYSHVTFVCVYVDRCGCMSTCMSCCFVSTPEAQSPKLADLLGPVNCFPQTRCTHNIERYLAISLWRSLNGTCNEGFSAEGLFMCVSTAMCLSYTVAANQRSNCVAQEIIRRAAVSVLQIENLRARPQRSLRQRRPPNPA